MSNLSVMSKFSKGSATAAAALFATASLLSSAEYIVEHKNLNPVIFHESLIKFSIFKNNEATGTTVVMHQLSYLEKQQLKYAEQIGWIDAKINNFMDDLNRGTAPVYSDSLLSLANKISDFRKI